MEGEYWVYILRCSDESFYVGITNNVERRIAQHNDGQSEDSYTRSRRPVELVHSSVFHEVLDAIQWEKRLKGWSHAKKEAFVNGKWERLQRLSQNYTEFSEEYRTQGSDLRHPSTGSG